jgi:hypothetical protein
MSGLEDTSNYLQERAFARAILTDDAKRLAGEDLESDIAERPEITMTSNAIQAGEFFEAGASGSVDGIGFGDTAKLNDGRNH